MGLKRTAVYASLKRMNYQNPNYRRTRKGEEGSGE